MNLKIAAQNTSVVALCVAWHLAITSKNVVVAMVLCAMLGLLIAFVCDWIRSS